MLSHHNGIYSGVECFCPYREFKCYDYLCVCEFARVCACQYVWMSCIHSTGPNGYYVNIVKQHLSSGFTLTRLYHKRHIMVNDLVQRLLCFCTFIVFLCLYDFIFFFSLFCLLLFINIKTFFMDTSTNANNSLLIFVFEVNAIFTLWK